VLAECVAGLATRVTRGLLVARIMPNDRSVHVRSQCFVLDDNVDHLTTLGHDTHQKSVASDAQGDLLLDARRHRRPLLPTTDYPNVEGSH
jgi:hypothetical protein